MKEDTRIGGPRGNFPATRWSAVVAARSEDPRERSRALDAILVAYWKPIYKYLRIRWNKSNEHAKDATQEFLTRLIEKEYLSDFDPAKARLRTFLRVCVDHFVANQTRAASRLKRGGDVLHVALEFEGAEAEFARAKSPLTGAALAESFDAYLEKEFVRNLFTLAVADLRAFCEARGKLGHFQLFERYDLDDAGLARPSYAGLAREFGVAVTDVTNHLAFARREFRRIALEKLREMTCSEAEFRREARALLGMEPL
jgi:DNA-directed RNA polymerase specialized sigma24 family protein